MVLKIYGLDTSISTRRVIVTAKELGIKYELVIVDLKSEEHKKPEHMAMQPFGQIPYIDDDGFILYESRAIAKYLAAKAKSPLLPTGDLKTIALFEQAVSVENNSFDNQAYSYLWEKFIKPTFLGRPANEENATDLLAFLTRNVDSYEAILSKQKYLAGDNITLADLFHLPTGTYLTMNGVDLLTNPSRPHVAKWWKEISTRPTWLSTIA